MTVTENDATATQLTLLDELVLTLLNEESGYFRQVPGWNLNCAVVGAALAELSLIYRIDTDMESLILLDQTRTGDPCLDPILSEIVKEPVQRNAQYWIERLAPKADSVIDATLARLVDLKILQHHEGDFWSLAQGAWKSGFHTSSEVGTAVEFVKTRISRAIFNNEIPGPRDVIIICLIDTCDVLRYIFELDEESEARVEQICKMDLIGRSIADAVSENIAVSLFQRTALTRAIPRLKLRKALRSKHLRKGNVPAFMAELHKEYGPVFDIRVPFQGRMIFLAGPETNHWVHRHGRMHLRARDYLEDFEKVYGGVGLLPALDGADHFRYRKSIQPGYARGRLEEQLDMVFAKARENLATWNVGEADTAVTMCRNLINSELSPLTIGIDSNDVSDDMHKFKERALKTHLAKTLPKFMLHTPSMKRRAKLIDDVVDRVLRVHTPAQRAGCPRDLADELLNMHGSDRQFLPESNLRFVLSAPLIASMYVGDQLSFIAYAMLAQPEYLEKIRDEADALFSNGDPDRETLTGPAIDVTRRFIMECLRMYPIVPMSVRNVMNKCVVEGYELPEGARVFIAQTATHYMSDHFPDPFTFDIDRYQAPRKEHIGSTYAPYGLGTHTCLGIRWTELQLAINLLMMVHYYELEIAPRKYKLKISPFPSMSPNKKLKFRVAGIRHELPA
ncbi:MAG: cytochrome P450 [Acidimicrobiia bacterium]|nr:cytochrome P450 [Acidimicrobiia bacterium]MYG58929.1 cytochrome P450 [Acidimicrobiia bacterium]MYJ33633.1 cytochrome P450 [Acidimicrobiia bacterium]